MNPARDHKPLNPALVLRRYRSVPYSFRMKNDLAPGITRTQSYLTTLDMRARQLKADVFSTPAMIGLMERTCVDLTEPYLEEDEQTVGMHVDIYHLAPTKIGQAVIVTAELLEVRDNKIRYSVSASNDQGIQIGVGKHRRAVIKTKRFANGNDSKQRSIP